MGRFDLIYKVLVQKEFSTHKTSKAVSLKNLREVVDYNNANTARRRGEPRIRDDPEAGCRSPFKNTRNTSSRKGGEFRN